MFLQARFKLTLFYSLIFFILFWSFSLGLYFLMGNYLHGSYITQVRERHFNNGLDDTVNASNVVIATTAGNMALEQLRIVLLYLNGSLLLLVPSITWMITGQTLLPLKEAHEREQQFVSDASHELRTPLSIMLGEIDVTMSKPRTAIEYLRLVNSLREEVGRLIALVENLLLLARVGQKKSALVNQQVDLVDTVVTVLDVLKAKLKSQNIKLSFIPPEEASTIEGNQALITQLIYNLVENAIKYTPKLGTITITIQKNGSKIKLKIKDTGIGIPKDVQDKIFDRFYRADASRTRTRGYGLGLSISQAIINVHHGDIKVSSSPGKGTQFTVTLPIKQSNMMLG